MTPCFWRLTQSSGAIDGSRTCSGPSRHRWSRTGAPPRPASILEYTRQLSDERSTTCYLTGAPQTPLRDPCFTSYERRSGVLGSSRTSPKGPATSFAPRKSNASALTPVRSMTSRTYAFISGAILSSIRSVFRSGRLGRSSEAVPTSSVFDSSLSIWGAGALIPDTSLSPDGAPVLDPDFALSLIAKGNSPILYKCPCSCTNKCPSKQGMTRICTTDQKRACCFEGLRVLCLRDREPTNLQSPRRT